jgi:hypothetical protein
LGDEAVYLDRFVLADAVGAVCGLVFDGGVPPAVVVDDVVCAGRFGGREIPRIKT